MDADNDAAEGESQRGSPQVPLEALGAPGTYQELWFEGSPRSEAGPPNLGVGPWSARAYLSRAIGAPDPSQGWGLSSEDGSSYAVFGGGEGLVFTMWAEMLEQGTGNKLRRVEIKGYCNAAGQLASLEASGLPGASLREGRAHAMDMLIPYLSRVSFEIDAPLWIAKTVVTCEETGARHIDYRAPYRNSKPDVEVGQAKSVTRTCQAALALYLEGLAASSANYAYLCFFRVSELILSHRRRLERRKPEGAVRTATSFPPTVAEWEPPLTDVLRREFRDVLADERVLSPRNHIAHGFRILDSPPDNAMGVGFHLLDAQEPKQWLPVVKYMAREMLTEELKVDT